MKMKLVIIVLSFSILAISFVPMYFYHFKTLLERNVINKFTKNLNIYSYTYIDNNNWYQVKKFFILTNVAKEFYLGKYIFNNSFDKINKKEIKEIKKYLNEIKHVAPGCKINIFCGNDLEYLNNLDKMTLLFKGDLNIKIISK